MATKGVPTIGLLDLDFPFDFPMLDLLTIVGTADMVGAVVGTLDGDPEGDRESD